MVQVTPTSFLDFWTFTLWQKAPKPYLLIKLLFKWSQIHKLHGLINNLRQWADRLGIPCILVHFQLKLKGHKISKAKIQPWLCNWNELFFRENKENYDSIWKCSEFPFFWGAGHIKEKWTMDPLQAFEKSRPKIKASKKAKSEFFKLWTPDWWLCRFQASIKVCLIIIFGHNLWFNALKAHCFGL